jgi:glutathione synthase/RimK-type ligase-like ATP-grasp enzyme
MKIAIHERKGSFSDRWIDYCKANKIDFKIVNCYDTDILTQLQNCDGLMWHWSHQDYRAQNFARQLIYAAEKMGIKVFPDYNTCWHFDDKLGQKYLLESIDAPLVRSYAFYNKKDALKWVQTTSFPKVFKLRGGAGAYNVKLIKTKNEARKIINKAFGKGFKLTDRFSNLKQRIWVLKRDKDVHSVIHFMKGLIRLIVQKPNFDLLPTQKGYVYFQEFITGNEYDDRIIVVGNRAFALRRYVRKNDFRASGSGVFEYNKELFKEQAVQIAFNISKNINTQSLAFDFIYDKDNKPYIVEISYAYSMGSAYDNCPGYWDSNLTWHNKPVNPQTFIIEDFIGSIENDKKTN